MRSTGTLLQPRRSRKSAEAVTTDSRPVSPCRSQEKPWRRHGQQHPVVTTYSVSARRCTRSQSRNREEDTLCPQRREHEFEPPSSLLLPQCCCSRSSIIRISRT